MALLGFVKHRKPKVDLKSEQIRVRLTSKEKKLFSNAAKRENLNVSTWLRRVGMKSAEQRGEQEGG